MRAGRWWLVPIVCLGACLSATADRPGALQITSAQVAPNPFGPEPNGTKQATQFSVAYQLDTSGGLFAQDDGQGIDERGTFILETTVQIGSARTLVDQHQVVPLVGQGQQAHPRSMSVSVQATWDGRDSSGNVVPDGTYSYQVTARFLKVKTTNNQVHQDVRATAGPAGGSVVVDTSPPEWRNVSPPDGLTTMIPRTAFSAVPFDSDSGPDPASIRLRLDGVDVTAQATIDANGVRFTPPADLAFGSHVYEADLRDLAGNPAPLLSRHFTVVPITTAPIRLVIPKVIPKKGSVVLGVAYSNDVQGSIRAAASSSFELKLSSAAGVVNVVRYSGTQIHSDVDGRPFARVYTVSGVAPGSVTFTGELTLQGTGGPTVLLSESVATTVLDPVVTAPAQMVRAQSAVVTVQMLGKIAAITSATLDLLAPNGGHLIATVNISPSQFVLDPTGNLTANVTIVAPIMYLGPATVLATVTATTFDPLTGVAVTSTTTGTATTMIVAGTTGAPMTVSLPQNLVFTQGTTASIPVTVNSSDPVNTTAVYSILDPTATQVASGAVALNAVSSTEADGTVSWPVGNSVIGVYTLTVQATLGTQTAQAVANFSVHPTSPPPVVMTYLGQQPVGVVAGTSVSLPITISGLTTLSGLTMTVSLDAFGLQQPQPVDLRTLTLQQDGSYALNYVLSIPASLVPPGGTPAALFLELDQASGPITGVKILLNVSTPPPPSAALSVVFQSAQPTPVTAGTPSAVAFSVPGLSSASGATLTSWVTLPTGQFVGAPSPLAPQADGNLGGTVSFTIPAAAVASSMSGVLSLEVDVNGTRVGTGALALQVSPAAGPPPAPLPVTITFDTAQPLSATVGASVTVPVVIQGTQWLTGLTLDWFVAFPTYTSPTTAVDPLSFVQHLDGSFVGSVTFVVPAGAVPAGGFGRVVFEARNSGTLAGQGALTISVPQVPPSVVVTLLSSSKVWVEESLTTLDLQVTGTSTDAVDSLVCAIVDPSGNTLALLSLPSTSLTAPGGVLAGTFTVSVPVVFHQPATNAVSLEVLLRTLVGQEFSTTSPLQVVVPPPTWTNVQPGKGAVTIDRRFAFSGTPVDDINPVDPKSIHVRLDGVDLGTQVVVTTLGVVQASPPADLTDGMHRYEADVADTVGIATPTLAVDFRVVSAMGTIDPTVGGTVTVQEPSNPINGVSVVVPSGATPSPSLFTIARTYSPPALPDGFQPLGSPSDIQTTVPLQGAVTVRIPFDPAQLGDIPPEVIVPLSYDLSVGQWQQASSFTVDTTANQVVVQTKSLSIWQIGIWIPSAGASTVEVIPSTMQVSDGSAPSAIVRVVPRVMNTVQVIPPPPGSGVPFGPGAGVQVRIVSGGGTLGPVQYVGSGVYQANLYSPRTTGTAVIQASSVTLIWNVVFNQQPTATYAAAPASMLVLMGPAQAIGRTMFPFVIRALDRFGNVATGYTGTVIFTISDPTAQVNGARGNGYMLTFSASQRGVATVMVSMSTLGTQTILVQDVANGLGASWTMNIVAGPPAVWTTLSGDGQVAEQGRLLLTPLSAALTDAYGNVVAGYPVTGQVTSGGGALLIDRSAPPPPQPISLTTDGGGAVTAYWLLGPSSGIQTATFTANGTMVVAPFTATATSGPPAAPVLTAPPDGFLTSSASIAAGGSAPLSSTVQVMSDGAVVGQGRTTRSSATFSVTTSPLPEGTHVITAVAIDDSGATSAPSNAANILVDLTPPRVTIQPADGTTITEFPVTFSVVVTDSGSGLADAPATVTFNGLNVTSRFQAQVPTRFQVLGVSGVAQEVDLRYAPTGDELHDLVENSGNGTLIMAVSAQDRSGNPTRNTASFTVDLRGSIGGQQVPPSILLFPSSGQGQTSLTNRLVPGPIEAIAVDGARGATPISGVPLAFLRAAGEGTVIEHTTLSTVTSQGGLAGCRFINGSQPGTNVVAVAVAGDEMVQPLTFPIQVSAPTLERVYSPINDDQSPLMVHESYGHDGGPPGWVFRVTESSTGSIRPIANARIRLQVGSIVSGQDGPVFTPSPDAVDVVPVVGVTDNEGYAAFNVIGKTAGGPYYVQTSLVDFPAVAPSSEGPISLGPRKFRPADGITFDPAPALISAGNGIIALQEGATTSGALVPNPFVLNTGAFMDELQRQCRERNLAIVYANLTATVQPSKGNFGSWGNPGSWTVTGGVSLGGASTSPTLTRPISADSGTSTLSVYFTATATTVHNVTFSVFVGLEDLASQQLYEYVIRREAAVVGPPEMFLVAGDSSGLRIAGVSPTPLVGTVPPDNTFLVEFLMPPGFSSTVTARLDSLDTTGALVNYTGQVAPSQIPPFALIHSSEQYRYSVFTSDPAKPLVGYDAVFAATQTPSPLPTTTTPIQVTYDGALVPVRIGSEAKGVSVAVCSLHLDQVIIQKLNTAELTIPPVDPAPYQWVFEILQDDGSFAPYATKVTLRNTLFVRFVDIASPGSGTEQAPFQIKIPEDNAYRRAEFRVTVQVFAEGAGDWKWVTTHRTARLRVALTGGPMTNRPAPPADQASLIAWYPFYAPGNTLFDTAAQYDAAARALFTVSGILPPDPNGFIQFAPTHSAGNPQAVASTLNRTDIVPATGAITAVHVYGVAIDSPGVEEDAYDLNSTVAHETEHVLHIKATAGASPGIDQVHQVRGGLLLEVYQSIYQYYVNRLNSGEFQALTQQQLDSVQFSYDFVAARASISLGEYFAYYEEAKWGSIVTLESNGSGHDTSYYHLGPSGPPRSDNTGESVRMGGTLWQLDTAALVVQTLLAQGIPRRIAQDDPNQNGQQLILPAAVTRDVRNYMNTLYDNAFPFEEMKGGERGAPAGRPVIVPIIYAEH